MGKFKERTFIENLRSRFRTEHPYVITGIGDDTAVIKPKAGMDLLVTSDLMTEGVHFSLDYYQPEDVAWRILAANLSDIAAMGGKPLFFTMSLAIPPHLKDEEFIDRFIIGISHCSDEYEVELIGGDTSSSLYEMFIDVMMIGEVKEGKAIKRSGAAPGDLIYIIGTSGMSEAGLQLFLGGWWLERGQIIDPNGNELDKGLASEILLFLDSHLRPGPMIEAGRMLSERGLVTAMIDTSDGISTDLHHICEESNVGARLFYTSFNRDIFNILQKTDIKYDPRDWILNGGEDFSLLFTIKPADKDKLTDLFADYQEFPLTQIGEITDETGIVEIINEDGSREILEAGGWEHK